MTEMEVFGGISSQKLNNILSGIKKAKIVLIGDICLDVYWKADMTKSELSRETPHFPLPVVEEWMSPGGGGNAAANIAALQPESIKVVGVRGKDWRGDVLLRKLQEAGVNTDSIAVSRKMITNAYCKPLRKGISGVVYEDPRLDFNNYEDLPEEDEEELLEILEQCADDTDVLCVSDQLVHGCVTAAVREKILSLARQGIRVVVDSRDRIGLYTGVILKPNEVEGARAAYGNAESDKITLDGYFEAARILAEKNKSDVCMTLGKNGCVYTNSRTGIHVPSFGVNPPIDICGAGDTFLSAFSCALATGAAPAEAASFANMAAEVTIKKIGITGTASPEEIRERHTLMLSSVK